MPSMSPTRTSDVGNEAKGFQALVPPLNADILSTIISYASQDVVLNMMQAGRLFYHEGPKVILRNGASLENEEDVQRFLRFILAEEGSRCRYLTSLSLGFQEPELDGAQRLVELLLNNTFPALRTLSVECSEELFRVVPGLASALSTLSSITSVNLEDCGRAACKMLVDMGPKLVVARLIYDVNTEIHPLTVLEASRDTLDTLELLFYDGTPHPSLMDVTPFSKMRELEIGWMDPSLVAYAYAFPNVAQISFQEGEPTESRPSAEERKHTRAEVLRVSTWKNLQYVSGLLTDVWASGLVCDIQQLVIHMDPGDTLGMLIDVLNDTRPLDLSATVKGPDLFSADHGLPAVFQQEGATRMTRLRLSIALDPADRDADMAADLALLIASMQDIPLERLELSLGCADLPESRIDARMLGQSPSKAPPCLVEQFLRYANLPGIARLFLSAIPSLSLVDIKLRGHRTRGDEQALVSTQEDELSTNDLGGLEHDDESMSHV